MGQDVLENVIENTKRLWELGVEEAEFIQFYPLTFRFISFICLKINILLIYDR